MPELNEAIALSEQEKLVLLEALEAYDPDELSMSDEQIEVLIRKLEGDRKKKSADR